MSGGFLSLEGVRKEFGGVLAVDTFDLEVAQGEFSIKDRINPLATKSLSSIFKGGTLE